MAFANGGQIVTSGLVLALDAADRNSYPGSGTTWRDMSGNGNTGTLTNGPTFSTGSGGNIVFDGTNDYVDCGGNAKPVTAITVNAWIYFNTAPAFNTRCLSDWHQSLSQDRWIFYFSSIGQVTWYLYTTSQTEGGTATYTVPTNTWINLCGTYDSTIPGGTNAQRFYINGQLYASTNRVGIFNVGTSTFTVKLGGQVSAGGYINGNIASFQMYNRALSDAEILQNYNATKTRFGL